MSRWQIDKAALKVAIARELERQGVDPEGRGEVSAEQMSVVDDCCESIAWALATEFGRDVGDSHPGERA